MRGGWSGEGWGSGMDAGFSWGHMGERRGSDRNWNYGTTMKWHMSNSFPWPPCDLSENQRICWHVSCVVPYSSFVDGQRQDGDTKRQNFFFYMTILHPDFIQLKSQYRTTKNHLRLVSTQLLNLYLPDQTNPLFIVTPFHRKATFHCLQTLQK